MLRLFLLVVSVVNIALGSCPESNYYGPCLCMEDVKGQISLQCSDITDPQELIDVFTTINETFLGSVDIVSSPSLTYLPDNLFGDVAVEAFRISSTGITQLQHQVFGSPAAEALKEYYIRRNKNMTELDGNTIFDLSTLESLFVSFNGITRLSSDLPDSSTLTSIDLSYNDIQEISDGFFKLPNLLTSVAMIFNNLTTASLIPNSLEFSYRGTNLVLDLSENRLEEGIPMSALSGTVPCQIILTGNEIVNFDFDHFSTLVFTMDVMYGSFQPNCYIMMDDNPLNCDCSIQWLIESSARSMVQQATCSDGTLVSDLTIEDFVDC